MKSLFLIFFALIASGCQLCREHPVACAIGGAVIVGSVAAIVEHQHDVSNDRQIAPGGSPQCRNGACK